MDWQQLAKQYEVNLVEDLKGLIAIPSLLDETTKTEKAPFGLENRRALDYMFQIAKRDGFKVHDIDGYAGIIEYGTGSEIVGVLGHLDVVPAGTGWNSDPFTLVNKEGYLFGRGTMDDKGPTMAAYYALKMIKDLNIKLNRRIFLILGCDEETGMRCMEYYRKHAPIPDLGFVPDADFPVIYGEKGIINLALKSELATIINNFQAGERPNIVIGEASASVVAPLEAELFDFYLKANHLTGVYQVHDDLVTYQIKGEFAHGAMPETGNNAGLHLLRFIGGAYQDEYALLMSQLLGNYYGKGLDIMHYGTHMGYLTLNVGKININQQQQNIVIDIRHPHDLSSETILEKIKNKVEQANPKIAVVTLAVSDPLFVDPNSKLVSTLVDCYQSITGDKATPSKTIGGGTYARCFDNFVAFGPDFSHLEKPDFVGQVHQANEAASLKNLLMATAIYAKALKKLAE